MKCINRKLMLLLTFLITLSVFAATDKVFEGELFKKSKVVLSLLENILENYHYRRHKIDDSVSSKAFGEFLKRLDYGKQFLLQEDVKKLEVYKLKMDDELDSGKLLFMDNAISIIKGRIAQVEDFRKEIFKSDFDFTKDEQLEIDPDKRKFVNNTKQLKDLWRKIFKHSILVRYLAYIEEQETLKKAKKDKKAKKGKKVAKSKKKKEKDKINKNGITKDMGLKELKKKAVAAIAKKYKETFERMLKDDFEDYFEKYINSIANVFDPHTLYFPPKKKEDFDIQFAGSLEGIGAVLQEEGEYIKVVKIVPGGPAWKQKDLSVDDLIIMVRERNGEPVDLIGMRVDDAVRYIRGKKDTTVKLTVKRADGSIKVIPIKRGVVQIGETFAKSSVISSDKLKGRKFGYIVLPSFYRTFSSGVQQRNCTDDVRTELERLKKQKVDGIILDLRSNGGGSLSDAVDISGLFIKDGPIVQVRDQEGKVEVLKDHDSSIQYGGPLVVLINRFSASASEILAAALQDYGRAPIVGGELSHGKGTVQQIIDLNRGQLLSFFGRTLGAVKLTIQQFYRVTGPSTQYKGVVSDVILPDPYGHTESGESDLDYSLPWDKIAAQKFKPWNKKKWNLKTLKRNSKKRVSKSKLFKKLKDNIDFVTKRRQETLVSLNIKKIKEDNSKTKKKISEFKIEEEDKSIKVSHLEESLMSAEKVTEADKVEWKKDFERRKEEWLSEKRKDIVLIESFNILNDLIGMTRKK